MRRLGLATLSGGLLVLSFPKFGHWAVAWVALAPLLAALPGTTTRQAAGLGYVTGFVSSLGLLYWTALVVVQYGGLSTAVGIAVMVLLCMAVALFTALFAAIVGRWTQVHGAGAVLLAPPAWVACEVLRAHAFYRFPWCLLGYSQQQNLPIIQIASLTAVYGVSFLLVWASAVVACVVVQPEGTRRRRVVSGFATGAALVLAFGAWALGQPAGDGATLRVGLVQASIPQEEKWDPAQARRNLDRHVELTRKAAAQGARLVVWPESSVPGYYDSDRALRSELQTLAKESGAFLLFGNDDREDKTPGEYRVFVGAKMIAPNGDLELRYHKIRLVPFGEYVPMKPLLTLGGRQAAKLVREVADFTPGSAARVGDAAEGRRIGAFICYEAIFPDLVRRFAAGGADLLVNITNDAWYGRTSAPYQHFAMAVFRAVENGRTLVRAANTGITAVVDPRGRVLAHTVLFEPTVLVHDAPVASGRTFYAGHGDVFAWACFGVTIALTAASLRRR